MSTSNQETTAYGEGETNTTPAHYSCYIPNINILLTQHPEYLYTTLTRMIPILIQNENDSHMQTIIILIYTSNTNDNHSHLKTQL
jgi:hypothetical protein